VKKVDLMIVEDEIVIQYQLKKQLERMGFHVSSTATRGMEAINKAEKQKPDVVLMDIQLEGDMDGIEAASIIKNRFDIPIIFTTAYADEEKINRAKLTVPYSYLVKPVKERDLKIAVDMAFHVSEVNAQRKLAEMDREMTITRLEEALESVKKLSGLIPICAKCKKIRNDAGYWNQVETYIENHSEAVFSHAICPECAELLYKDTKWYQKKRQSSESSAVSKDIKHRILVVDDNLSSIHLIKTILAKSGFDAIAATNGPEAIELAAAARRPDLILLDVHMIGMDGFETCRRLKQLHSTAHIPVIFLTANTETKSIAKGFELGAVDYVTKPLKAVELRARIKTHLELRQKELDIIDKNNEQKELLHILCHDLTNPLANLETLLEMYKRKPSLLDELIPDISISIQNGLELIDQVRKMRAVEEEKYEIQLQSENLYSVTMEAISIIRSKAERKNIAIEVAIDSDHSVMVEKTSLINSVLNNLFTNAIKFSFNGSKIEVKSVKKGKQIHLSIIDFGLGMPSRLVNDIFDISKATSRPGTEEEKGTGFGMPLVKKFVLAYGGGMTVVSEEKTAQSRSHGTEIVLMLNASN